MPNKTLSTQSPSQSKWLQKLQEGAQRFQRHWDKVFTSPEEQRQQLKGYRNTLTYYIPYMTELLEREIPLYRSPVIDCHTIAKKLAELEAQLDKSNRPSNGKLVKDKEEDYQRVEKLYQESISMISRALDTALYKALLATILEQNPWVKASKIIQSAEQAELPSMMADWGSQIDQGGGDSPIKNQASTTLASVKEPSDLGLVCYASAKTDKTIEDRVKSQLKQTTIIKSMKDEMNRRSSPSPEQITRIKKAVTEILASVKEPPDLGLVCYALAETDKAIEDCVKSQLEQTTIIKSTKDEMSRRASPSPGQITHIKEAVAGIQKSQDESDYLSLFIKHLEEFKKYNKEIQEIKIAINIQLEALKADSNAFILKDIVEKWNVLKAVNQRSTLEDLSKLKEELINLKNELEDRIIIIRTQKLNRLKEKIENKNKKISEKLETIEQRIQDLTDHCTIQSVVRNIHQLKSKHIELKKEIEKYLRKATKSLKGCSTLKELDLNHVGLSWAKNRYQLLDQKIEKYNLITGLLKSPERLQEVLEHLNKQENKKTIIDLLGQEIFEFLIETHTKNANACLEQLLKSIKQANGAQGLPAFQKPLTDLIKQKPDKIIKYLDYSILTSGDYFCSALNSYLDKIDPHFLTDLLDQRPGLQRTIRRIESSQELLGLLEKIQDKLLEQRDIEQNLEGHDEYDSLYLLLCDFAFNKKPRPLLTPQQNEWFQAVMLLINCIAPRLKDIDDRQDCYHSNVFFRGGSHKKEALDKLRKMLKTSIDTIEGIKKLEETINDFDRDYGKIIDSPRCRMLVQLFIRLYYLIMRYPKNKASETCSRKLVDQLKESLSPIAKSWSLQP